MSGPTSRAASRAAALALSLLLAACGSAPPAPAPEPAAPSPAPVPVAPGSGWRAEFERQQVDLALAAESRGHWATALLNWEVLTLVRPEEASYQARWVEARRKIDARVSELLAAADSAQRRGDPETASRAWLDVLALEPGHAKAADSLRQLERERTRRANAGRFARSPGMAGQAEGGDAGRSSNSVREHASMLAQQGDVDGAIGLLRDAPGLRNDAGLRGQLADLYVQKAEGLRQRQPEAARAAVDAALAIDRRHPAALALQQQLPPPRPRAAPGTAPAPPGR